MKILSLIVPSYNSEKFLDKCIGSFINDQIIEQLDIIIVNDGSTDNTMQLASTYCEKYPNSIRLINQENKGHGGALNTGCNAARGKYFKVIDADDWVVTENLSEFVNKLSLCNADIVLTHHYTFNIKTNQTVEWKIYPNRYDKNISLSDVTDNWGNFDRSFTFHGITYKTDFYQAEGHILTEGVFYEDHEFSTFPACNASSVCPMDLFLYVYRIGDVNQSVSEQNSVKRLNHTETVLKRFVSENKTLDNKSYSQLFVALKAKILLISYLSTALLSNKDRKAGKWDAKRIMLYFKQEFPAVYSMCRSKYRTLRLMHFLRIKKSTLNRFVKSKLYCKIKGTKNFN